MLDGYHNDLDTSQLIVGDEISKYRMIIGFLNWDATLGRFEAYYVAYTMLRYHISPKQGHLDPVIGIFGYLKHYIKKNIIFDSEDTEPPHGDKVEHNWSKLYPYDADYITP